MITIVDYGSGNVGALARLCKLADIPVQLVDDPDVVGTARHIILPGGGAIDTVMASLSDSGMRESLLAAVASGRSVLLGVCVGMHALAHYSEEGQADCLGLIDGKVERFHPDEIDVPAKLPHMGWNSVEVVRDHALMDGIELGRGFYFLHSYHFSCSDDGPVIATAHHGGPFPCIVGEGNVLGVQFHPEKSHSNGTRLIRNFAALQPC